MQKFDLHCDLKGLIDEYGYHEFVPCAYYDKHLDCIRVQTRDCSITEVRLDSVFTIYQANHAGNIEFVGFTIKGVRHFVNEHGLPSEGPIVFARMIDEIVKIVPDVAVDFIQRYFSEILDKPLVVEDLELAKAA